MRPILESGATAIFYIFFVYFSFSAENVGSLYFLLFFGPKMKLLFWYFLFFGRKGKSFYGQPLSSTVTHHGTWGRLPLQLMFLVNGSCVLPEPIGWLYLQLDCPQSVAELSQLPLLKSGTLYRNKSENREWDYPASLIPCSRRGFGSHSAETQTKLHFLHL